LTSTHKKQKSLARDQGHLVGGVAEKTLGEQLAADDDVPAHGEDADEREAAGDGVDALADDFGSLQDLGDEQQDERRQRAEARSE
jgi:hypothetical protein